MIFPWVFNFRFNDNDLTILLSVQCGIRLRLKWWSSSRVRGYYLTVFLLIIFFSNLLIISVLNLINGDHYSDVSFVSSLFSCWPWTAPVQVELPFSEFITLFYFPLPCSNIIIRLVISLFCCVVLRTWKKVVNSFEYIQIDCW